MEEKTGREMMIEMSNIHKSYMLGEEKVPVLKDICFSVKKGEYVAILGPSGSGKTTLMNILGCMDLADSGSYYLDGVAVHETREEDMTLIRNQKIGFIFQNYPSVCWELITEWDINRRNCRADRSRGFRLQEPWPVSRLFCWRMSLPGHWIPAVGRRC